MISQAGRLAVARQALQRGRHRGAPLMSGRPAINQPAVGAAPPMEPGLVEREALTRIRRAGDAGVAIGDDLSVSLAIRLGMTRLVEIDNSLTPARVRARGAGSSQ